VDEGSLSDLRHLGTQTVDATFDGEPPAIAQLDGVSVKRTGANALRFEVSGPVGPLITALGQHQVIGLTSRAPSLEEIFLHHYAPDGGAPDDRSAEAAGEPGGSGD